jgi:hypothetical protein
VFKKVNPANELVPPEVVTEILPLKPSPTTAVIEVLLTTLKEAAEAPPKFTTVAPVKFVPVIVIVAPEAADVGAKEAIVGD